MARRYSSADTIRDILNVSAHLFAEKGYEQTTIQDIVQKLDGLSRGAIYHHFKSKEEIADTIIEQLTPAKQSIEAISQNAHLNGLEKMQQLLFGTLFNQEAEQLYRSAGSLLDDPKFFVGHTMHHNQVLAPYIEAYIDEGNQDGSTSVQHPGQVAEIVVLLLNTWFTRKLFPHTPQQFWEKLSTVKHILDNLGLRLLDEEILQKIEQAAKGEWRP